MLRRMHAAAIYRTSTMCLLDVANILRLVVADTCLAKCVPMPMYAAGIVGEPEILSDHARYVIQCTM